jgi:ribonuclease R
LTERRHPSLPSKAQILEFVNETPGPTGKREIAREFGIKGAARQGLKKILSELQDDGLLERGRKRRLRPAGALPPVLIVDVVSIDSDGDPLCTPARWDSEDAPPIIHLTASAKRGAPAPAKGDRILARVKRVSGGQYEAEAIRVLGTGPDAFMGVYEVLDGTGSLSSIDRKRRTTYPVEKRDNGGAANGDVVEAEIVRGRRGRHARITAIIGSIDAPSTFSLIALKSREIPVEFHPDALAQAEKATPAPLELGPKDKHRADLRDLPLITIDGADARDFDDAVWAAPDDDPKNPSGWRLIVAIADVSWYVRPGDALDISAKERGTSVYFPDRVTPMLPEALSNDLCSLRPNEDRACVAAHIWIDNNGAILRSTFERALMRSAARLTYEQVQAAHDGATDDLTAPLATPVIAPLYGAYATLEAGRIKRGTLEIDLPELQIYLGDDGHIGKIEPRPRLDSHRLIEEFMITANVAAAKTLAAKNKPFLYRVHEPPSLEKLEALRESLAGLGYKLAKGAVKTSDFTGIIRQAAEKNQSRLVNTLILRSQSKAVYTPELEGHFGLALSQYCHFTSPIRRYPDIIVHRALVDAYRQGPGGLTPEEADDLEDIGDQTSITERRAESAERDAKDRYIAAFMAEHVGATFKGHINGVARFGFFVTLDDTGADGLVPVSTLPWDRYFHEETAHRLVGQETGNAYTMGAAVKVKLAEANIHTGGLVFHVLEGGETLKTTGKRTSKRQSAKSFRKIAKKGGKGRKKKARQK